MDCQDDKIPHIFESTFKYNRFDKILIGQTLLEKYRIKRLALQNNNFKTFFLNDASETSAGHIVRFSLKPSFIKRELQILERINTVISKKSKKMRKTEGLFPKVIESGLYCMDTGKCYDFEDEQADDREMLSFIIMTKSGRQLSRHVSLNRSHDLNLKNVYTIGLKLLDVLEIVHEAGYIYNDLNLDNISFGADIKPILHKTKDYFEDYQLNLWDFSAATPYRDFKTKQHLPQGKVRSIMTQGNMFASVNQQNFLRTSRKDDLDSLCSLMIALIHSPVRLPEFFLPVKAQRSQEYTLFYLQSYRQNFPITRMCFHSEALIMVNFCQVIENLSYSERPDYEKLRQMLRGLHQWQNQQEFQISQMVGLEFMRRSDNKKQLIEV